MSRGERPIKLGDSWYSSKWIEVQPCVVCSGGRERIRLGPFTGYQTEVNSECRYIKRRSETVGDKVHRREGKSPDRRLRSQKDAQWKRKCDGPDSQEVGLEAAIPLKSA